MPKRLRLEDGNRVAISIEKNFDAKKLADDVRKKQRVAFERELQEAAREIVERTRSQTDVSGTRFKKLTEPYRKYKTKSGRQGVPDLTLSGSMLRSIIAKVEETAKGLVGTIFFNSAKEAEKARGNMKIRKFFGLSKEQIAKIVKAIGGK